MNAITNISEVKERREKTVLADGSVQFDYFFDVISIDGSITSLPREARRVVMSGTNFSDALEILKDQRRVARRSWIRPTAGDPSGQRRPFISVPRGVTMHFCMTEMYFDGVLVSAWNPTFEDLIASDWLEIEQ